MSSPKIETGNLRYSYLFTRRDLLRFLTLFGLAALATACKVRLTPRYVELNNLAEIYKIIEKNERLEFWFPTPETPPGKITPSWLGTIKTFDPQQNILTCALGGLRPALYYEKVDELVRYTYRGPGEVVCQLDPNSLNQTKIFIYDVNLPEHCAPVQPLLQTKEGTVDVVTFCPLKESALPKTKRLYEFGKPINLDHQMTPDELQAIFSPGRRVWASLTADQPIEVVGRGTFQDSQLAVYLFGQAYDTGSINIRLYLSPGRLFVWSDESERYQIIS